jgi:hypothetical protein
MKNLAKLPTLIVGVSLFASCVKTDLSSSGSISQTVSSNANVVPELNNCRIRRIYQDDEVGFGNVVTAVFTYNAAKNPYTVIYSNGGTGVYDHYFYYDAQNRLKQWNLTYAGFPIVLHFYKYNSANQIVTDSAHYINAGNGELGAIRISTLEYDAAGRVIKETIRNTFKVDGPLEQTRRPTYTYDVRGNLAVAGWKSSSYDNKINPLRQNAIFQFIHRNYSMNNAAPQPKYNSLGEPLSMKPTNDPFFNYHETLKVIYDCL